MELFCGTAVPQVILIMVTLISPDSSKKQRKICIKIYKQKRLLKDYIAKHNYNSFILYPLSGKSLLKMSVHPANIHGSWIILYKLKVKYFWLMKKTAEESCINYSWFNVTDVN